MTVDIVYRSPSQTSFLETINENFYKLDTIYKEIYTLGDFNINLYLNNKYIFEKKLDYSFEYCPIQCTEISRVL